MLSLERRQISFGQIGAALRLSLTVVRSVLRIEIRNTLRKIELLTGAKIVRKVT